MSKGCDDGFGLQLKDEGKNSHLDIARTTMTAPLDNRGILQALHIAM